MIKRILLGVFVATLLFSVRVSAGSARQQIDAAIVAINTVATKAEQLSAELTAKNTELAAIVAKNTALSEDQQEALTTIWDKITDDINPNASTAAITAGTGAE